MKSSLKKVAVTLITSLVAMTLNACGDGSIDLEARLRVFHASPDAPNVDVSIDGGRILEDVPYGASSEFLPLSVGLRHLTVSPAGGDAKVIDAPLRLLPDTDYLAVAAGKLAEIAPLVFIADRSAPPSGSARVRVLHTAASAPAVDIYVTSPGDSIGNATPVLSNVPFKAMSEYLTVPAGVYDIRVTVAGTKTVAIEALNFELADGLIATVAALDNVGGGAPFSLTALDER